MDDLERLAADLAEIKSLESRLTAFRRQIEDRIVSQLGLPEPGKTTSINAGSYSVSLSCRLNRTVDGDTLQQLAAENGLSDHLGSLFRWKPEINAKQWNAASDAITGPLLGAITSKPARPTLKITKKDD